MSNNIKKNKNTYNSTEKAVSTELTKDSLETNNKKTDSKEDNKASKKDPNTNNIGISDNLKEKNSKDSNSKEKNSKDNSKDSNSIVNNSKDSSSDIAKSKLAKESNDKEKDSTNIESDSKDNKNSSEDKDNKDSSADKDNKDSSADRDNKDSSTDKDNKDSSDDKDNKNSSADKDKTSDDRSAKTKNNSNNENKPLDSNKKDENASKGNPDVPYIDPSIYYYKKKKKRTKIVLAIVAAVVICVYVGGFVYFSNHFSTKTYINDIEVSGKSIAEVESILNTEMDKYHLDILFTNGKETLNKGDGGISYSLKQSVLDIRKQNNAILWFIDLFTESHYKVEYVVNYDKKQLSDYILGFNYFLAYNMQPSINAKVEMTNGEVIVTPEKLGTKMDKDLVMDKICSALDSYLTTIDLVEAGCYIPAEITENSESIINTKKNAEAFLAIKAVLSFGGYQFQIPREDLSEIGTLNDKGEVEVTRRNVDLYVKKLDERFTTIDKPRKFETSDGKTILIYGDGYYGWIMDPEKESEELYDYLSKKKDFNIEAAYKLQGYAMCDTNDIGNSYVEINLTKQHVWLYINGRKILESDCVTGRPSLNTPGGLYGITYKAYDATLKGPDYETKVSFWMPFNWDIGLHDAAWRADFGGDIYTYDGSHGCVNLPYDVAQTIFDYVEGGFPVVCYWEDEVQVISEN